MLIWVRGGCPRPGSPRISQTPGNSHREWEFPGVPGNSRPLRSRSPGIAQLYALLLELALHLPRGGAAEGWAARRWRAPFRSTSLRAEEPAANDAAGPKNGQAGKVVPGGHWAASGADFRDQPPRARAVVAGRVPAKSRDRRRDFCPKPRPGEKRGPHIDRHPMGRCRCFLSQIVDGHTDYDTRRCGGPIGAIRGNQGLSSVIFHGF